MNDTFIKIENLSYAYTEDDGRAMPVLRDVSLDIRRGEYVAILGHNGSGKSTLAKLLNLILTPTSGKIIVDGIKFDSRREAKRYAELRLMERAGVIHDLQRQVKFELIPSQRYDGKVIERPVNYYADFTYMENGNLVVEDVKGMRTKDYILKRKMLLYLCGIRIREV